MPSSTQPVPMAMSSSLLKVEEFRIPLAIGYTLLAKKVEVDRTIASTGTAQTTNSAGRRTSLLVVHGGPGLAHHGESYPGLIHALEYCPSCHAIFFFDQLGCGESDKPDPFPYSLPYYTEELAQVIEACATRSDGKICLLGHSWGGQIVLEYLTKSISPAPHGGTISPRIHGAILSNVPLDMRTYECRQRYLRSQLDEATQKFLHDDEESQIQEGRSVGASIYRKLVGARDTDITGELRGWSLLDTAGSRKLEQLAVPCLFVTGKLDTVRWQDYAAIAAEPHAHVQIAILEQGGHGPFFGPTAQEYFGIVASFLGSLSYSE